MNKKNRLLRIGTAALCALLMAGSCAQIIPAAMGLSAPWTAAWLPAAATALLCGLAGWSAAAAIAAALTAAVGGGLAMWSGREMLAAVKMWAASLTNPGITPDAAALAQAGAMLTALTAVALAALLYLLLSRRGGVGFALVIFLAAVIVCYALAETLPLVLAAPGLMAALFAFAGGGTSRDAGAWRVVVPVVLAVCAAMLLTPSERLTWEPLERAAQRVRAVFEDYFRFTQERISFTISTEGYNHAAETEEGVVTRLGGPARPNTDPVMAVTADGDILLRGSIRRVYTGSAWIDTEAKARYLYYDFTRSGLRDSLFGMSDNEGFAPVAVQVEMLDEGTSTLFVPGRMEEFSMSVENAVHYNSIGEMFLSRQARAGDAYALVGCQPEGDALREAVLAAAKHADDGYNEIYRSNMQIPDGVEEGVYALTVELTKDCYNAYDKAAAIMRWLRENCAYTLEPDYPQAGRDFVSQFVLEDREGYCSYFASAMTVMCRIAGLPARYVEGYAVKGSGERMTLTGEDAHAWTEVYFSGLGWVAFDPSNGADGGEDGRSDGPDDGDTADDSMETQAPESDLPNPSPSPEPTPPLDNGGLPDADVEDAPTPSPTPDSEEFKGLPDSSPQPTLPPEAPEQSDGGESGGNGGKRPWLWWILIALTLLALIALAIMLLRARLASTDPLRMSGKAKSAQTASLMLYRGILTLLAVTGQTPMSGETPGAFARRTGSEAFVRFTDALALSIYARESGLDGTTVELGRRAYSGFLKGLKRGERLRYCVHRLMKGLGSIESIP